MNVLRSVLVAYLLTGVFFTTPAISSSLRNETSDTVKTVNGPQNLKSVGKSQFIPIFGDGKGKLARRQLDDFDKAALKACGAWGGNMTRDALVALLNDPNLKSHVQRIYENTDRSAIDSKPVGIESFKVSLVDMLFSGGAFKHLLCGEPKYRSHEAELVGLHYDARIAELQDQGFVGLSKIDCERSSSNHPVYTFGMNFLMPDMKSVGRKCPTGFVSQSAADMIITFVKANKEALASGRKVCLHKAMVDNEEVSFLFVRDKNVPLRLYSSGIESCERWGKKHGEKNGCLPCNTPNKKN